MDRSISQSIYALLCTKQLSKLVKIAIEQVEETSNKKET